MSDLGSCDRPQRHPVNPAPLFNGTKERLLVLIVVAVMGVFWLGMDWPTHSTNNARHFIIGVEWGLIVVLVLIAIWAAAYWLQEPLAVRRFRPLMDVSTVDAVLADRLCHLAKVVNAPDTRFVLTADASSQEAIAIGATSHRTVLLGGGMRLVVRRQPELFDAIVLHELAHHSNGDVKIAYLAKALRSAFTVIAILTLISFGGGRTYYFWEYVPKFVRDGAITWAVATLVLIKSFLWLWKEILFWGILFLIEYCSLMKVREHYADLAAFRWGAPLTFIARLRAIEMRQQRKRLGLFLTHPTLKKRIAVLENPELVLKPTFVEGVVIGLTGGLLFTSINQWTPVVSANSEDLNLFIFSAFVALLQCLWLVSAASQTFRLLSYEIISETRRLNQYENAFAFICAIVLGFAISFILGPFSWFHSYGDGTWTTVVIVNAKIFLAFTICWLVPTLAMAYPLSIVLRYSQAPPPKWWKAGLLVSWTAIANTLVIMADFPAEPDVDLLLAAILSIIMAASLAAFVSRKLIIDARKSDQLIPRSRKLERHLPRWLTTQKQS